MIPPEFSYPVSTVDLLQKPQHYMLRPNADESAALCRRFALVDLPAISAKCETKPTRGGRGVLVTGEIIATVVQRCVISLEPVTTELTHSFTAEFAPLPLIEEIALREVEGENSPEIPEPFEGDAVDLGELVAQELSIALPAYPRKEGAAPLPLANTGVTSPFAVLKGLIKDDQ